MSLVEGFFLVVKEIGILFFSRGLVSSGERRSLHQDVLICGRCEWVIIMFIVRKLSHNSDFEKGPEIIIFFTIIK